MKEKKSKAKSKEFIRKLLTKIIAGAMALLMLFAVLSTLIYYFI